MHVVTIYLKTVHAVKLKTMRKKIIKFINICILIIRRILSLPWISIHTTPPVYCSFAFYLSWKWFYAHFIFFFIFYSAWKSLSCFCFNLIFNYCDYFRRCLIFLIVAFVNALKKWTNESLMIAVLLLLPFLCTIISV